MRLGNKVSVTGDRDILEAQTPHENKILERAAKEVLNATQTELDGRTFAVRCKRQAEQPFTFVDTERHIGALLMREPGAVGANRDKQITYLLFCKKGMICRLHASHRKDAGFMIVAVYRQ